MGGGRRFDLSARRLDLPLPNGGRLRAEGQCDIWRLPATRPLAKPPRELRPPQWLPPPHGLPAPHRMSCRQTINHRLSYKDPLTNRHPMGCRHSVGCRHHVGFRHRMISRRPIESRHYLGCHRLVGSHDPTCCRHPTSCGHTHGLPPPPKGCRTCMSCRRPMACRHHRTSCNRPIGCGQRKGCGHPMGCCHPHGPSALHKLPPSPGKPPPCDRRARQGGAIRRGLGALSTKPPPSRKVRNRFSATFAHTSDACPTAPLLRPSRCSPGHNFVAWVRSVGPRRNPPRWGKRAFAYRLRADSVPPAVQPRRPLFRHKLNT